MKFLKIETPGTKEYKEYQELIKENKREQRAKEQLPQIVLRRNNENNIQTT